ncbi:peroxiredoxin family protein [Capnocytophaga canis]|uniref:peroxiredoxin family protein n=1 Tax=Capnocytophaga canis TaxID=1848903 RepID=UPI0037D57FB5
MNKKSIIKRTILLLVLCFLGFMGYKMYKKMSHKKQVAQQIAMLPAFSFTDLEGNTFTNSNLKKNLATIFVYFNSECDYCLHEAQSIRENLLQFDGVQFVFVSIEPIENIKKFAQEQQLLDVENVIFLQDKVHNFAKDFDANNIPYSLIYNKQGTLLARHKGQIKAETILRVLAE